MSDTITRDQAEAEKAQAIKEAIAAERARVRDEMAAEREAERIAVKPPRQRGRSPLPIGPNPLRLWENEASPTTAANG